MVESLPNSDQILAAKPIKFLCSYGGRILPRYPDGKLRYYGGETRVLSVDRSISFSELAVKLSELCGTAVNLRCQLPTEDLDSLVSITSDEDLANLIEEYDAAAPSKIRAFLSAPKPPKKSSSPPSSASSSSNGSSSPKSPFYSGLPPRCQIRQSARPPMYSNLGAGKAPYKQCQYHHHHQQHHVIHSGNHLP